jgi:zinc transport system substrate-binding protein
MSPLLAVALACTPGPGAPPPPARTTVVAASVPVHHLALRLGAGQPWELVLLPPPDADPGVWRPSADDIGRAQSADLVLLNGAGYEAWAMTAALPATGVVHTAQDVPPLRRASRTHSHGAGGGHAHGEVDPHTWTDPGAYARQAAATHGALAALPGADRVALDGALATLVAELTELEAELQSVSPGPERGLASNHPSFGHLGRRLGLRVVDFDLDPETPPDAATASRVTAWATQATDPVMLWEAEPAPAVAAALPATLQHLTLDPLEHPAAGGRYDYGSQTRANVAALGSLVR